MYIRERRHDEMALSVTFRVDGWTSKAPLSHHPERTATALYGVLSTLLPSRYK